MGSLGVFVIKTTVVGRDDVSPAWLFVVDDTYSKMTTYVTAGRPAADATAGAARRRTVSSTSIRSLVSTYVNYRSSLPSRRNTDESRRTDDEDHIDGSISDVDDHGDTTNLPPGVNHAVRMLSKEFEQRYEQAS